MEHHAHGHVDPLIHMKDEQAIVRYIHYLYCIEMLRYANIANADLQVAYQYGQTTGAPWKDNPVLVREFFHKNRGLIRKFVEKKLHDLTCKLCSGLDEIRSQSYLKVPLDPQTKSTVALCLQDIEINKVLERIRDERKISFAAYSEEALVRHIHSTFMTFEIADRVLCGVFDNYVMQDPSLMSHHGHHHGGHNRGANSSHFDGPHKAEILDNKVYLCHCKVQEFVKKFNLFDEESLLAGHWSALASIFSIFYRLSIPKLIHPNRLHGLYDRYICSNPNFVEAQQKARKYSHLCIEAVLGPHFPEFNTQEDFKDSVLERGFSLTLSYPDSLVEKYLVTLLLFEPECIH